MLLVTGALFLTHPFIPFREGAGGGTYRGLDELSGRSGHGGGGYGEPSVAAAAEQAYGAKLLYKRSGRGAWPTCGRYL